MNSHYPYESFNARNYTPKQVAETFIPSGDYDDLWRNEHTVVLGPRGSGKTTLFKMLTVQALYSWSSPTAERLRRERPFTAIYVPADMHWHHQLKHAGERLQNAPRFSLAASRAAVTTSILLAASRTFKDRLEFELRPNNELEIELCSTLIRQWRLPKMIPCLDVVILGLKSRMAEIRRILNEEIFRNSSDDKIGDVPNYFHLDYLSELDVACSAFDTICRIKSSPKWAICLDELELAPAWLQELAFSQQRSTEESFLFKLSTSPIPRTLGVTEARPKQDFRLICIWNHAGRDNRDFEERLARSVLKRRLDADITTETLFGKSELVMEAEKDDVEKYDRGSAEWNLFRKASSWDESLRALLMEAGLDPSDPVTEDTKIRDSILRKAKPVVLLRSAFLKEREPGRLIKRSRKLGTIYYGREAIYRVSDGNPRRLIGILGDLCERLTKNIEGRFHKLSENQQADVLTRASLQFSGYIHALPGGITPLDGNRIDLTTLIRTIAVHFSERLFGPRFELDPVGSFRIDSHINEEVVELLRLGVYHGAVVYVDPVPDGIETSLRGKRFRLSYMLSPLYKLPLSLYDPISLSGILRASKRLRVRRALRAMLSQEELPLDTHKDEPHKHNPAF